MGQQRIALAAPGWGHRVWNVPAVYQLPRQSLPDWRYIICIAVLIVRSHRAARQYGPGIQPLTFVRSVVPTVNRKATFDDNHYTTLNTILETFSTGLGLETDPATQSLTPDTKHVHWGVLTRIRTHAHHSPPTQIASTHSPTRLSTDP